MKGFFANVFRLRRKLLSLGQIDHSTIDWMRGSGIAEFRLRTEKNAEEILEETATLSLAGTITCGEEHDREMA